MKRRLELMPEVLPSPTRQSEGNVRARTLARLKVLTAISAGVAVSCGKSKGVADSHKPGDPEPYGVVDPMPRPTCFEGPQPTISAVYVNGPDAGAKTLAAPPDTRLIAVTVSFTQADVALGDINSADAKVTIVESQKEAKGLKLLVRVPKTDGGTVDRQISVTTSCALGPSTLQITLRTGPTEIQPQVYAY